MGLLIISAVLVLGSNMYVNSYIMKKSMLLKPAKKAEFDKIARNIDIVCSILILIILALMFMSTNQVLVLPANLQVVLGSPIIAIGLFTIDLAAKILILNKYLKEK